MSEKPEKGKSGDGTVILSGGPPRLQPQPAARATPDDDEGDVTQVLQQPEPGSEATLQLSSAPPALGAKPAPAPQASSAPAETFAGDDRARPIDLRSADADTVHWTATVQTAWLSLERALPSDHAGVERIERKVSTIGRSLESDVRLYSASASRTHARIEQRDGGWYLVSIEGRKVLVDDEVVEGEVLLEQGMRLGLGDDVLVVLDLEEPQQAAPAGALTLRWQVLAAAALGGAIALLVLLRLFGLL